MRRVQSNNVRRLRSSISFGGTSPGGEWREEKESEGKWVLLDFRDLVIVNCFCLLNLSIPHLTKSKIITLGDLG